MPNLIDASGLQTKALAEYQDELETGYRDIYGEDIVLDSNSPDGQQIGITGQLMVDQGDLITNVNAMMDPDQAIGAALDMRCALNGVKRKGGTFSLTEVSVTTDRAVSLQGLDTLVNDPNGTGYTISDNAGNQFILANSYDVPGAGSWTLVFRAKSVGAIQTSPNTITNPVTVVIGVLSVNNPSAALTTGEAQEQDGDLKIRRRKSVSLASSGFQDALEAALLNVDGVVDAIVYENESDATDGDGIPSHSIWVVVTGGADIDIAKAIYAKRSGGCGQKGGTAITILRTNGKPFTAKFDRTGTERLYASFNLNAVTGNLSATGNTTNGSNVVTGISSTAGMEPGYPLRMAGVPAGARVGTVDSLSQIHIYNDAGAALNATATAAGVAMTVVPIVASFVRQVLVAALDPGVNETIDINELSTIVKAAIPNSLATFPTGTGLSSDGISYAYQLSPATKNLRFTLANADVRVL